MNKEEKEKIKEDIICPKCYSNFIIKCGFAKDLKHIYRCNSCNKRFKVVK